MYDLIVPQPLLGIWGCHKEKVVQVMQLACNSLTSEHPIDEISYRIKNLRGRSKAKRQGAIDVGFPFPAYTKEVIVSWVNWELYDRRP